METDLFERFENGALALPGRTVAFDRLPWNKHPAFEGVELKHIVGAADTGGDFSYHLVRIAPGKAIGDHIHDPQLETHEVVAGKGVCLNGGETIAYRPGMVSIFQARTRHEVRAGEEGLLLFAKFMPALC